MPVSEVLNSGHLDLWFNGKADVHPIEENCLPEGSRTKKGEKIERHSKREKGPGSRCPFKGTPTTVSYLFTHLTPTLVLFCSTG